jgi:Ca2+/Na+ antiporter
MSANYQSPRQRITRLLMVILIVLLVVYVYIRISTSITERQISNNRNTVQEKTRELDSLFSLTGFTRLEDVQIIREGLDTMPRSTHISTLIDMINTIEQIDSADGDSIVLSDFRVTLDDLSVK